MLSINKSTLFHLPDFCSFILNYENFELKNREFVTLNAYST